tara:strand:- start:8548 stop:9222 length:675 start_codon:yes stop_codon:yes gene_type:complete
MSKAAGQANIETFEKWRDTMLRKGFSEFKQLVYRGDLSRSKVAKSSKVDLNALKEHGGNPSILRDFDELVKLLQKNLPDLFIVKKSALEKYHDYVEQLEMTGGKFPVDAEDDLDVIRLAKNIGFPTARLSSPSIKKQLNDDIKRIGTELVAGKTVEERMEDNLISTSSELSKCRKDLAVAQEKIDGLTKQNLQLHSSVRKLQKQSTEKDESLEHAIHSGRRFAL